MNKLMEVVAVDLEAKSVTIAEVENPFENFTEAQLREWNNVFRTSQRYIDPTPIKMEMDILELRLSETKRADRYSDIVDRLNELQDKLVEAYDR
jgi:hypothetical protein